MPAPTDLIFSRMRVPGHEHVYVLGCFERPATVYMQQVRALNLIYALQQDFGGRTPQVAIVGGGAAGATASAAAALLGWDVTILDKHHNDILSLAGANAPHRWLHPHIYDWPEDDKTDARAGLCILDWTAGQGDQVINSLRTQWQPIRNAKKIKTYVGALNVVLEPLAGGYYLQWNSAPDDAKIQERRLFGRKFDVVILAVGFGVEESSARFKPVTSYWDADNLSRNAVSSHGRQQVLVSGTGDGGLIDVLRLTFNDFKHEQILRQLQEQWLAPGQYEVARERLKQIEAEVRPLFETGKPYLPLLNHAYHELVASLRFKHEIVRRTDFQPVLTGMSPMPLTLEAAPINRFLFALAQVQYIPGPLVSAVQSAPEAKWTVQFDGDGKSHDYDHVVVRHGASSVLARDFPTIYTACTPIMTKVGTVADPTRRPMFSTQFAQCLSDAAALILQNDGVSADQIKAAVSSLGSDTVTNRWIDTLKVRLRVPHTSIAVFVARSVTQATAAPPARVDAGPGAPGRQQVEATSEWVLNGPTIKIIVGTEGSGKSTLLQMLCADLAADATSIPLVASQQHVDDCEKDPDAPTRLVAVLIDEACGTLEPGLEPAERDRLRNRLLAMVALGRAVLFLPDTDAAAGSAERRCALIERLQRYHPGIRIVTASDDAAAMTRSFPSHTYQLDPLSHRDVQWLVSSRLASARGAVAPALLAAMPALLGRVTTPRQLLRLLDSPLQEPGGQDLHPWIVATVNAQFQSAAPGAANDFVAALGRLAYRMLEDDQRIFTISQLENAFQPPLPEGEAERLLSLLNETLLVPFATNAYSFALPVLLDCLAAHFMLEHLPDPESAAFALVLNPRQLDDSEAAPMIIGRLAAASPEAAAALLGKMAALPESLDWQVLRFRIRSLRYVHHPASAALSDIVQALSAILGNQEKADEQTLQKLGEACNGAGEDLAAPLLSAADAILRGGQLTSVWRAIEFLRHARLPGAVAAIGWVLSAGGHGQSVLETAAQALGAIGDDAAIPFLARAIRVPPGTIITVANYNALGRIGTPAARDQLINILANDALFENYRWPAAAALAHIRDATAETALLKAAESPISVIRAAALEALGSQTPDAALPLLLAALHDDEAEIRCAAVNALGQIREPSTTPDLVRTMADDDHSVRAVTAKALANLDTAELTRALQVIIADRGNTWRGEAAALLPEYQGDSALDILKLLAEESSDEVKQGTARGLGFIRHAGALETLKLLLQDRSVRVREEAAAALSGQEPSQARPLLLSVMATEVMETVRSKALQALRRLPDPANIPVIVAEFERDDASRYDAVLALGAIGTPEIGLGLRSAWLRFDTDIYLKRYIARVMAHMAPNDGARMLAELYDAGNNENRAILINYGVRHLDDGAVVPLIFKAMSAPDEALAKSGEKALRSLSANTVVAGLRLSLRDMDRDVRLHATQYAPFYADQETWQMLRHMAGLDEAQEVRAAAQHCLASYTHSARAPTSGELSNS